MMTFGVYLYFIGFLLFSGLGLFVQYKYFSVQPKKSKKEEYNSLKAEEDKEIEQLLNKKQKSKKK